jgi:hypothetical protein
MSTSSAASASSNKGYLTQTNSYKNKLSAPNEKNRKTSVWGQRPQTGQKKDPLNDINNQVKRAATMVTECLSTTSGKGIQSPFGKDKLYG